MKDDHEISKITEIEVNKNNLEHEKETEGEQQKEEDIKVIRKNIKNKNKRKSIKSINRVAVRR